jgi:hypothetical protein
MQLLLSHELKEHQLAINPLIIDFFGMERLAGHKKNNNHALRSYFTRQQVGPINSNLRSWHGRPRSNLQYHQLDPLTTKGNPSYDCYHTHLLPEKHFSPFFPFSSKKIFLFINNSEQRRNELALPEQKWMITREK